MKTKQEILDKLNKALNEKNTYLKKQKELRQKAEGMSQIEQSKMLNEIRLADAHAVMQHVISQTLHWVLYGEEKEYAEDLEEITVSDDRS